MSKYKFNDYTLPGLPEGWSPIAYPYAVIIKGTGVDDPANGFNFWLVCSGEEYTALNVDGTNCIAIKPYTVVHQFLYVRGNEEWVWEDKGSLMVEDMDSYTMADVLYYYFNATKTEYIWCNEDIKDTSGNVVFAGSEPVLVEADPEDPEEPATKHDNFWFWFGVALGLAGKGLPKMEQKPTAYLYNGVKLPALPEWDREMYPYALIYFDDYSLDPSETYILAFARLVKTIDYSNNTLCECVNYYAGDPHCTCTVAYGEPFSWGHYSSGEYKEGFGSSENDGDIRFDAIDWANFDLICQTDIYANEGKPIGSVYLNASDPIPVYE